MQIDYTAKRSLKIGHLINTAYIINVDLVDLDRKPTIVGSQSVALSGNTVSVIHRGDETLSVRTVLIDSTTTPDIDDMREFLESVKFGETFQLDSVNYIMANFKKPYQEIRVRSNVDRFRYSFMARKL